MRRPILIAVLAVGIAIVGSIAVRKPSHAPTPTAPEVVPVTTAPSAAHPVGPSLVVDGMSHGWSRDAVGAEAAAVAAVRATGSIAKAGFISRSDLIRSIASAAFGPKLAAASSAQLAEMTAELGAAKVAPADIVWVELLRSRIVDTDLDRAVAEVWSVLVVGVAGKGAPRQVWRTVTVTLVWERDDWRIDDWTTVPGPTPALTAEAAISDVPDQFVAPRDDGHDVGQVGDPLLVGGRVCGRFDPARGCCGHGWLLRVDGARERCRLLQVTPLPSGPVSLPSRVRPTGVEAAGMSGAVTDRREA